MSAASPPVTAAGLLAQLSNAVELESVCIPTPVQRAHPELDSAVTGLGLSATHRPAGDEDVLCLLAGASGAETLSEAELALRHFRRLPFLLILALRSAPNGPLDTARALLTPSSEWLVQAGPDEREAILMAPEERILSEPALPGAWQPSAAADSPLTVDQQAVEELWRAAERDRKSLSSIAALIDDREQRLQEARGAWERLSAEVERLRASERREVDRLRLAAMEERAWVAEQAIRLGQSTSWRLGHRIVRVARRLTFRRDRGTDLPAKIAQRMQDGEPR